MKYILFIFCLTLLSCQQSSKHGQKASEVISSFNNKAKNNKLIPFGSGGSFLGDIKGFSFVFKSKQKLNIEQARSELIKNVENLLYDINSNVTARPYYHQFPFTVNNLDFCIIFENSEYYVPSPFIAKVYVYNSNVVYKVYDKQNDQLLELYRESYDEALMKLK